MKINELSEEEIVVGLKVKSLCDEKVGVIVKIDYNRDNYAWILWEGEVEPRSGFFGNQCACEVIL